jgi:hypothetical protein
MPDQNGSIAYRLQEIERDLREHSRSLRLVDKHEEQISGASGLTRQINSLADEVSSLRKAIIGAALGLPIAGVTFMLGVLALVQP